jgi:peptide deformylase
VIAAADVPEILIHGDPTLRASARPLDPDEDPGDLPDRLLTALAAHDGVGLAAPQIGDLRRVIVVADPERRPLEPLVMVNPEIDEHFGPEVPFEEGCLSFPGRFYTLWRPRGVAVRYRDQAGRPQQLRDDSLLARVIQHEVDHLDGVLFVDHLPRWRRWLLGFGLRQERRAMRRKGR